MTDDQEEEDPFFKSVFKTSQSPEDVNTAPHPHELLPNEEDASKVGLLYLDKHSKKYTYDMWGNKQHVDDSLSPINEEIIKLIHLNFQKIHLILIKN